MKTSYFGKEFYSPAFQEMMDKKLSSLEKFFKGDSEAKIELSKDGKNYKTAVNIEYRNKNFRAVSLGADMYDNILPCMESLKKQIIDSKSDKKSVKGFKHELKKRAEAEENELI